MENNIYQGRKILITGASSGIGLEFARILSHYNCTLILVAFRFKHLEEIRDDLTKSGKAEIFCFKADLGKIEEIKKFCDTLEENDLIPDILINNAGRQSYGYFYKLNWEEEYEQLILNCVTPIYLIHRLLPWMIRNNFGKILNVGSVAGTMPGPFFATYSASKAFLNSFSQSINGEMRNKNIQCACLLPGKTNCKNFWNVQNLMAKIGDTSSFAFPHKVAKYGLKLLENNIDYGVYGLCNKTIQFIRHFTPRRILVYILRKHTYNSKLLE